MNVIKILTSILFCSSLLFACTNETDTVKSFGKIEQKNHNLQARMLQKSLEKNNVQLINSSGEIFSLEQDTNEQITLIAMGYASCPDICPMHLSVLAGAYNNLPLNMQRNTKIIFISADPYRDKQKITKWVKNFHEDFIGLTGTDKNLIKFQEQLKLPPAILVKESPDQENYAVSHASWITVFTKDNLAHFIYPLGITQREWVADLKLLHENKWEIYK